MRELLMNLEVLDSRLDFMVLKYSASMFEGDLGLQAEHLLAGYPAGKCRAVVKRTQACMTR